MLKGGCGAAGDGARISAGRHKRCSTKSKSGAALAQVSALRAENARRARLTALLRRVYAHGPRLTVEMTLRLAELLDAEDLLEQLATRFVVFDPAFLRDCVGHEFPPAPIRLIKSERQPVSRALSAKAPPITRDDPGDGA